MGRLHQGTAAMQDHPLSGNGDASIAQNDRAISIRDASRIYGLPEHALRRYQSSGVLDFYKIGRAVFLSENSLRSLMSSSHIAATQRAHQGCRSVSASGQGGFRG